MGLLEIASLNSLSLNEMLSISSPGDECEAVLQGSALTAEAAGAQNLRVDAIIRRIESQLAGSARSFERGWISLHQILASRPDGDMNTGALRGAQTTYPFNREYIYGR